MSAPNLRSSSGLFVLLVLATHGSAARGDAVALNPVADTTLIGAAPDNNNGGQSFVNAGVTQNDTTNRALFRFDIGAQVPAGSKILRADLTLEVVHQPPQDGYKASAFDLHRLLQSWGEGNKTNSSSLSSPNPGLGEPATPGEATWNARFAFTTNLWNIPGGVSANDYVSAASSSQQVYGILNSPYTFESTPRLVADVQLWLERPENNFGWLLKSDDEAVNWTACRFGSREDAQNAPRLTIEYDPARIDRVQKLGDWLAVSFTAQANQAYAVEFRTGLSSANNWSTFTNVPAQPTPTNVVVTDPISNGQRFYRLRLP